MKIKDIKIGEEYAIGPPNRVSWRGITQRIRAKVVATGVHGLTQAGGFYGRFKSDRAIYVQFEFTGKGDEHSGEPGYEYTMAIDSEGELQRRRYGDDTTGDREVYRALGTNVLRPWAEHMEQVQDELRASAKHEAAMVKNETEHEAAAADIYKRFEALGYPKHSVNIHNHNKVVEFTFEQVQAMLQTMEAYQNLYRLRGHTHE